MMRDDESQGPVIRDRRRIDPATGQVRDAGEAGPQRGPTPGGGQHRPGKHSVSSPGGARSTAGSGEPGTAGGDQARTSDQARAADQARAGDDAAAQVAGLLAERTADLQRLQAEYANYRKRVERDRLAVREQALANVLNELLPVLDDIGRAREHGELAGGFKSVAESLEGIAVKLGLTSYGENGDPFDPTLHEALMHSYSADVAEPTCVQILQPGYRVGERIIRPARVAVAEPSEGDLADGDQASGDQASGDQASGDLTGAGLADGESAGGDVAGSDAESAGSGRRHDGDRGAHADNAAEGASSASTEGNRTKDGGASHRDAHRQRHSQGDSGPGGRPNGGPQDAGV